MKDKLVCFLDTNVLLDNPEIIIDLVNKDYSICISKYVLNELDSLKHKSNLSYIISKIINYFHLYFSNINIFKLYYIDNDFSLGNLSFLSKDDIIILDILKYIKKYKVKNYIIYTNDKIFQLKCKLYNLKYESYKKQNVLVESQFYTGLVNNKNTNIYKYNYFYYDYNNKLIFKSPYDEKYLDYTYNIWKVTPYNQYQNMMIHLLLQDYLDIVSIQSEAGYGKSYISLAIALYLTLDRKKYDQIYIIKPIIESEESLGYLPGEVESKLEPHVAYIKELVLKLHKLRCANKIFVDAKNGIFDFSPSKFKILSLSYMRGINIENSIVIIDEAQNFSRTAMRTILSRLGKNVKCIILGDVRQIDNPKLNIYNNGLNIVVSKFINEPHYAHLVLKGKPIRGKICEMVLKYNL